MELLVWILISACLYTTAVFNHKPRLFPLQFPFVLSLSAFSYLLFALTPNPSWQMAKSNSAEAEDVTLVLMDLSCI